MKQSMMANEIIANKLSTVFECINIDYNIKKKGIWYIFASVYIIKGCHEY